MKFPDVKGSVFVLTSDETLMSNFKQRIHYGFASCFPTDFLAISKLKKFCPPVERYSDGRVKLAPLSLRVVESTLHRSGYKRGEYVTVCSKYLSRFIGSKTRVIGISTIDPLGLGPLSKTLCFFYGGEPHTKKFFCRMMSKIKILKEKHNLKVVVGGPGAWQLSSEAVLDEFGIDHLVIGEAEKVVPNLFKELVERDVNSFPRIVRGKPPSAAEIPPILDGTINGIIEASRGCGRGCVWCFASTGGKMRCLPISTIKESAEANIRSGMAHITLQSDDILLYGSKSKKFIPDADAVLTLLKELFSVKGIGGVFFIHFSIASVAADPELLVKVSALMKNNGCKHFDVQIGVETGSSHMIEKYMRGKALPFTPDEWPATVKMAAQILKRNGWFCYATLILGLPQETSEDIAQTVELIKALRDYPMAFIPLFFVPVATAQMRENSCLSNREMLRTHSNLLREVIKHNERIASRYPEHAYISDLFLFKR